MSQEAAGESQNLDVVEEVVVTGSRIRRNTYTSAAPMDVVLAETAISKGVPDLATMLQTATVAAGSPQVTDVLSGAGGLGASTLSLRGLGANRTLVLLNGRRAGPAGVLGSVSSFDLNVIPLPAIERVEVLKVGASAIYGSDAIGGVVNIITKKDEGANLNAFVSQPMESGGEKQRISGSWGKRFDRGYFRATADYSHQEIMTRGQRDIFKCDEHYYFDQTTGERADLVDPRTGEYFCDGSTWGHVWVYDYADTVGDGTTNAGPPIFLMQYDYDGALAANGVPALAPAGGNPNWMTTPPGWYPTERGDPLTNSLTNSDHPWQDLASLVPESDTFTLLLEGDYEINDDLDAYAEVLLSRRETKDVNFDQVWTYLYNYDSGDAGFASDPLSAGWTGAQWLSPLAASNNGYSIVTVDYQRFVAGARGESIPSLESWNWDVSVQYSRSDGEYEDGATVNDAVKMSEFQTGSCVGQVTPISNRPCVDVRWLDPEFLRGEMTQAERDFLFAANVGTTIYTQWSASAFASGNVADLPAGSVAIAVGAAYRVDELLDTPGALTLAENEWQGASRGITAGDDRTSAVFAEVDVPLLSDKPLVNRLDLTGAVRFTDVDSYGSGTTYQVGLNWAFTPEVRFRSTFGTSFRTPSLYELYLSKGSGSNLARNGDPCMNWGPKLALGEVTQRMADNCAAEGIGPNVFYTLSGTTVTGGGAGHLKAETSETFSAGFVWRPGFADLDLSVDYFDIEVNDEVDVFGAKNILFACYDSQFYPDDPLCDLFDRHTPDEPLPYLIGEVRDSFINIAEQRVRGVDIAGRYSRELPGSWGTLVADSQHTYQFEHTTGVFNSTAEDLAGLGGNPEWVGNLNLTLNRDLWSFFWGMRYVGSTDNTAHFGRDWTVSDTGETVDIDLEAEFTMYHNLSVSRTFENGFVARLGVANVLDELPPRMTTWLTGGEIDTTGAGVAFYSQYDWVGRRFFLNVAKDF